MSRYAVGFLFLACMLCVSTRSLALDPSLDAIQYGHTAWSQREASSYARITAFAQSADGYLWIGSFTGLHRFDGVRNVPWQPPPGASLPDRRIRALLTGRDGALWIGTDRGLASWRDGTLVTYPKLKGKFVTGIAEDREGRVWVGAVSVSGPGDGVLCEIAHDATECHGEDGRFSGTTVALQVDSRGVLWVASGRSLWQWAPGPPVQHALPEPVLNSRNAMAEAAPGELLVLTTGGIRRFVAGRFDTFVVPGTTQPIDAHVLMRDRDGALWLGTLGYGMVHVHQGRTDKFARSNGMSGDFVNIIFEDREGNVWTGTFDGIDRFRTTAATTYSGAQAFPALIYSVAAGNDESVWIHSSQGLYQWRPEGLRQLTAESSTITASFSGREPGAGRALFLDRNGRVWLGSDQGFGYLEGSRLATVRGLPAGIIDAITEDDRGDLWLAHREAGPLRLSADRKVHPVVWENPMRAGRGMYWRLAADPVQGGMWAGLSRGVVHIVDGQVRASYDLGSTVARARVNDLRVAADGALWIASDGGLLRLKAGRIAMLDQAGGLPCEDIESTIEDERGALWLFTTCGIVSISAVELAAWIGSIEQGQPPHPVQAMMLDGSEGTLYSTTPRPFGPHVAKSRDGKLLFATQDGMAVVDPRRLPGEQAAPPVHIESIVADRITYDSSSRIRLPALVRNLQIDYTATNLTAPERTVFRYKLEGYDREWQDAGKRRQAFYGELAPGDYRFRVIASNHGPWSEEGGALDFSIAPAYWQTWWFQTLSATVVLATLGLAYQVRVRRLQRRSRELRDMIETIPAMAWTARPDGSDPFINRRWAEFTGLPADSAAASGWMDAVHPEDRPAYAEKWRACLAAGEPFESEARFRGINGDDHWLLARAVPARDAHGRIIRWYGLLTDIADRKRAEEVLRASEEALRTAQAELARVTRVLTVGELTASIAHEVNQPLTGVITNGQACLRWLARDEPNLEEARAAVHRIIRDGQRASQVVTRIRALLQKGATQQGWLDLNRVLADMLALAQGELRRAGVSVQTAFAEPLPPVWADHVQLQQVVLNLLVNAIEAMTGVLDRPRHLHLRTAVDGQRILVTVRDTGVGLPPDVRDHMFETFYTTKPQGIGMGLAISHSIIHVHGGQLWALPNDDHGATLLFTLPTSEEGRG